MLNSGSRSSFVSLGALFAVSGFAALIYQVVWQRALYTVFGINVESVTVTVSSFLLGLGLGSLAGGFASVRLPSPVYAFAMIEGCIALFGIFSLQLFRLVGASLVDGGPVLTAVATMALLFFPTLLMGMTLPILVAASLSGGAKAGPSVGTLYFVNTMGSAVASMLSVTALMPFLGEQRAVWLAAGFNLLVAAGALWISRSGSRR